MMVVGPTGVGKSSLLNSLLCPARRTTEFEDCHFETGRGFVSVTKHLSHVLGPWLGEPEASAFVQVFDTAGLGDHGGLRDEDTLKSIIGMIISEPVQAILLVFKATDLRLSARIQRQLRTLEYILGPQLWDHVINVFTWWGFSSRDIKDRVRNCVKQRRLKFFGNLKKTRDHCHVVDFEAEKVEILREGFEKYLNVTKRIPHAFAHPLFNYENEDEKTIFYASAMTIYNTARNMSALQCDAHCQRKFEMALKSEKRTPYLLGRELQRVDSGQEINLACHLYLGMGNSTATEISWWHNSSLLTGNILVQDQILLDVIKESLLIIPNVTFAQAGNYGCSTTENGQVMKSLEVTVKVLPRKYRKYKL